MHELEKAYCDRETLQLTVRTEKNDILDRQAVAKLQEQKKDATLWQSTSKESEATFCVDFGDYDLEVSAVGYLTGHKEVDVQVGRTRTLKVEIILQSDPSAVELSASDDAIPPKLRKDAQRAVDELKSGNFTKAQKHLDKVYAAVPSSAQLNFLYGYLFLQLKDMEKSGTYLKRAVALNPRKVQALSLLGREQLQQGQTEEARKTLEQAVIANSADWMAHTLLADAYLLQKEFEEARQQAQMAIEAGKGSASAAQLALGQALAGLGHTREGIAALSSFLQTNADSPNVPQVKKLIAQIEAHDAGNAAPSKEPVSDLVLASSSPSLPPSAWGPPGVDEVKPFVAPGVSCPTQQVLQMAGERVKELVDSMSQFSAIEDLLHEQLDRAGNPLTKETRKFDYVASITEQSPGFLAVDEYRNNRDALPSLPDHISTQGFMAAALIFHPDMQENFDLTCEGLGQWRGNATWLVHFRQRDDKPKRLEDYGEQDQTYGVSQKGRVWINSDNFQVVRLESELVNSVQGLTVQHQVTEYGPVQFQKKNVQLWLPQSVDLFLEINRHRYYRRHSFDHYMLFSVNSGQKSATARDTQHKEPQSQ
jgi:tetratricopeptide (TPR) repeat protein